MRIEIKTIETSNTAKNLCAAMQAEGVPKGVILATLLRVATEHYDAMSALRRQNAWLMWRNRESHLTWRNEALDRVKVILDFLCSNRDDCRRVVEVERRNAAAEGRRPGQTKKRKKASPEYGRLVGALKLAELVVHDLIADGQFRAKGAVPSLTEIMPDFIAADEIARMLTRATESVFGGDSPEGTQWRRRMAQCVHVPTMNAISELQTRLMTEAQSIDVKREETELECVAIRQAVNEGIDKLAATLAAESFDQESQLQVKVRFAHPTAEGLTMELALTARHTAPVHPRDAENVTDLTSDRQRLQCAERILQVYSGGLTKSPSSGSQNSLQNPRVRIASAEGKWRVIPDGYLLFRLSVLAEERDGLGEKPAVVVDSE